MKSALSRLALLALPLLPLSPARAAIDPAVVSADARWMVYADLNALRGSALGKELISMAEKHRVPAPGGKEGAEWLGVDWQKLFETAGTVTAYGTNISPDPKDIDGVLIIQGTANLRKIAESLLLQANLAHPEAVAELTDLPFPAYALKPKPAGNDEQMVVIFAFPPEPVIIISKARSQILKARDVLRGAAPSLAKGPDSPLKKMLPNSEGAFLFTASIAPAEDLFKEEGPQSRILKMISSGSMALGERGLDTFVHSELVASSGAMADKLMKILSGMTAMLSLAETNDKQLADFLNSATVTRSQDSVTLDMAYSSERLAQMLRSLQQQHEQQGGPERTAPAIPIVSGTSVAQWQAEPVTADPAAAPAAGPAPLAWHTIENVVLKNGTLITLGRRNNGGRSVRFDRIEISPQGGTGAPLIFRVAYMQSGGRSTMSQMQFPGADGTYTLRVAYVNDSEGKASYAVSTREPKLPAAETVAPVPPPAPKSK